MTRVQIRLLGPLEIAVDAADAAAGVGAHPDAGADADADAVHPAGTATTRQLAGDRLRVLLAVLALEPGRVVPASRLVDAIWDDDPPANAHNALQALVSRLRRALPPDGVTAAPSGYRLDVAPDDVDAARFERLAAAGRARATQLAAPASAAGPATTGPTDPAHPARAAEAADLLGRALALWRGRALDDLPDGPVLAAARTRLHELRLAAAEARAGALHELGRDAEMVDELAALSAEHPLREGLAVALVRALAATGRGADALLAYERTRSALADELGADPSPELAALHAAVLRGTVRLAVAQPDAPPGNLPAGHTTFVGREVDVARVRGLVREYRLTTLVGPGGAGKTRLAVEAGAGVVDDVPDGVWLVQLAPVNDPAGIPSAVSSALGLRDPAAVLAARDPGEDATDRLASVLRHRQLLLVLDNCEHLVAASATFAARLLAACPGVRLLATSREPLGVTGEAVWVVAPLTLPAVTGGVTGDVTGGVTGSATAADADVLLGSEAVRLLLDRARAARPGVDLVATPDGAAAVVRICRALDGMPLAIELAAARLRTMTPGQLADRLDDRFRLLTGGSRTSLPQHRTLRAVVDWSWDLLTDAERALLRRLSVFAEGATVEAAEQVCADAIVPLDHVLDLLTGLADRSLLGVDTSGAAPRYRMLETIRAYGRERLAEASERERFRRAHLAYVATVLESDAAPHLGRAAWLARVRAEHAEVMAATRGAIAAGDADGAVRVAAAAGWYWWLGGYRAEGLALSVEALRLPGGTDLARRADGCAMVAFISTAGIGELALAMPWMAEASELGASLPVRGPVLRYLELIVAAFSGAHAVDLAGLDTDPDPWVRAMTRLGRTRSLPAAEREADLERALADFTSCGERWGRTYVLTTLAELAARRGDLPTALHRVDEGIAQARDTGGAEDLVFVLARQAHLLWASGDPVAAGAALAEADRLATASGWPDGLAIAAYAKAELARWTGRLADARTELARAGTALEGTSIDGAFRAVLLDSAAHVAAASGALDESAAQRAGTLAAGLENGDPGLVAQVVVGVADQAARVGDPSTAARLLAAAEVLGGGPDRSQLDAIRLEATCRAALGDGPYASLVAATRAVLETLLRDDPAAAVAAVREIVAAVLPAA